MPIIMKARPGNRPVSYYVDRPAGERTPPAILGDIARHLARNSMTATAFGRRAAGDPRLVFDLRKGRRVHPRLAARLQAYMAGGAA